MVLHSNNWYKQYNRINKLHEKISNQRKDYLHKLSTNLVKQYDIIALEDINLKNISQSLHLGKSTDDNGFGMFRDYLSYKAEISGKKNAQPMVGQCGSCDRQEKKNETKYGTLSTTSTSSNASSSSISSSWQIG